MGPCSAPQKLRLSCSTAARWGLSPSCWVPNPAQARGVKRFSKFLAPFYCTFSGGISGEAEQKGRWRDEDILCPSLPVKLNWSLPALLKIVILDKRLCNNLRNVWEDLVLILYKPSLTSGSLKSNLAELTRAVNMEPLDSSNRENWLTNLQYFDFFFIMLSTFLKVFTSLRVKIHIWLYLYVKNLSLMSVQRFSHFFGEMEWGEYYSAI